MTTKNLKKPTTSMEKMHKTILSAIPEGKSHIIQVIYGAEGKYKTIYAAKMSKIEYIIMLENMIIHLKSKRASAIRDMIE